MTRTKDYRNKTHRSTASRESIMRYVQIDAWRRIDLGMILLSLILFLAGRYQFIPFLFVALTVLEISFESAIRRTNEAWMETGEGRNWVGRMVAAGRLFFISFKTIVFLVILFLLIAG
jgi:hypothetical protein